VPWRISRLFSVFPPLPLSCTICPIDDGLKYRNRMVGPGQQERLIRSAVPIYRRKATVLRSRRY